MALTNGFECRLSGYFEICNVYFLVLPYDMWDLQETY